MNVLIDYRYIARKNLLLFTVINPNKDGDMDAGEQVVSISNFKINLSLLFLFVSKC